MIQLDAKTTYGDILLFNNLCTPDVRIDAFIKILYIYVSHIYMYIIIYMTLIYFILYTFTVHSVSIHRCFECVQQEWTFFKYFFLKVKHSIKENVLEIYI